MAYDRGARIALMVCTIDLNQSTSTSGGIWTIYKLHRKSPSDLHIMLSSASTIGAFFQDPCFRVQCTDYLQPTPQLLPYYRPFRLPHRRQGLFQQPVSGFRTTAAKLPPSTLDICPLPRIWQCNEGPATSYDDHESAWERHAIYSAA